MIQLTDEIKKNKLGQYIDASLYLIHFDSRNLAIVEGRPTVDTSGRKKQNVIGYYGSVKSALTKSMNIVLKHHGCTAELKEMLHRIDSLEKRIEELYGDLPMMIKLLKGVCHES